MLQTILIVLWILILGLIIISGTVAFRYYILLKRSWKWLIPLGVSLILLLILFVIQVMYLLLKTNSKSYFIGNTLDNLEIEYERIEDRIDMLKIKLNNMKDELEVYNATSIQDGTSGSGWRLYADKIIAISGEMYKEIYKLITVRMKIQNFLNGRPNEELLPEEIDLESRQLLNDLENESETELEQKKRLISLILDRNPGQRFQPRQLMLLAKASLDKSAGKIQEKEQERRNKKELRKQRNEEIRRLKKNLSLFNDDELQILADATIKMKQNKSEEKIRAEEWASEQKQKLTEELLNEFQNEDEWVREGMVAAKQYEEERKLLMPKQPIRDPKMQYLFNYLEGK